MQYHLDHLRSSSRVHRSLWLTAADDASATRTGNKSNRRGHDKTTLAYLSPPVAQQVRVNVVPGCHFTHAGTRLLRLRHYA